jgi:hypothetical protein
MPLFAFLIVVVIFSIPLFRIWVKYQLEAKRLHFEQSNQMISSAKQLAEAVHKLEQENVELRRRIENLEAIVTNTDLAADPFAPRSLSNNISTDPTTLQTGANRRDSNQLSDLNFPLR